MKADDETIAIFRADRAGQFKGHVTAVFPELPGTSAYDMTCYAHVGQHSSCTKEWYATTRPATYEEYAPLLAELVQIGYNPIQKQKITRAMDDRRRINARAA